MSFLLSVTQGWARYKVRADRRLDGDTGSHSAILRASHARYLSAEPESPLSMLQYKNKLALQKWRERFCAASSHNGSSTPLFPAVGAGRVFSSEEA